MRLLACDLTGNFPSAKEPIFGVPVDDGSGPSDPTHLHTLAGFAANGIARVDLIDRRGKTVVSAPVANNLYVARYVPQAAAASIVAYDGHGKVLYQKPVSTVSP